ncbi:MAG: hypothetical protein ABSA76_06040 [Bacteroidales bacterium]
MLQIINIPTEQTTAATDVLMAILAFIITLKVYRSGKGVDLKKTKIWIWVFGLLTFASAIGAIAHGFQMSKLTNFVLWQPLNLSLGLATGLFFTGVVYDFKNFTLPKAVISILIVCAIIFLIVNVILPNAFIVFIICEAIAMLFAFVAYTILASRKTIEGAGLMAEGIFVTIIAAGIQAIKTIKVIFIWEFDHNGIFHLVQMIGLIILLKGLQTEFRSRAFDARPTL